MISKLMIVYFYIVLLDVYSLSFSLILILTFTIKFLVTSCDLHLCSAQNVGVIVRLERENFHVLSMQGKVVEAKPQALHKKKEFRNTFALDSEQNTIQKRDIVKVIDGPHSVCFFCQ